MSVSRPVHANEVWFVDPVVKEMVQLCIEFNHPKYVPQVVDRFKRSVLGLQLKTDGKSLIHTNDPVDVARIPSHLSTTVDVCNWMDEHCVPTLGNRLATLACDDTRVAFNCSHVCADGGFLMFMLQNCLNSNLPPAPLLPSMLTDIFHRELDEFRRAPIDIDDAGSMTYWDWPKNAKVKAEGRVRARFIEKFQPAETLAGYDRKSGKVNALTESLWSGITLAISAMNGTLGQIGCCTCVNLRNMGYRKNVDLSFCNVFTNSHIRVRNAGPNVTIGELAKEMRSRFEYLKKNHGIIAEVERDFATNFKKNASIAHVSNVGPVRYEAPIVDFHMQQTMDAEATNAALTLLSWSKIGYGRNELVTRLRYSPLVMSDHDAKVLDESVRFYLMNITPNMTIGEAFNELQKFQKTVQ